MANNSNFLQAEKSKDNLALLTNDYKQLSSAIYSEKPRLYIVDLKNKTFWETCQEGLLDAKKIILEKFNQEIINFKNIEKCLN